MKHEDKTGIKMDICGAQATWTHIHHLLKAPKPICEINITYPYSTEGRLGSERSYTCLGESSWTLAGPAFEPRSVELKNPISSSVIPRCLSTIKCWLEIVAACLAVPYHCKLVREIQKDNHCSYGFPVPGNHSGPGEGGS